MLLEMVYMHSVGRLAASFLILLIPNAYERFPC